jgi:ribosomal protein S12 methylthiotransferase
MAEQVGARTREKRWHAVMAMQAQIAAELSEARLGRRERVLVESFDPERGQWAGRSAAEAPEIDGKVFIEKSESAERELKAGEFVDVEIVRSEVYDLVARLA